MHGEVREPIEWVSIRWHDAPDPDAPRVLLIGDSIAQAYSYAMGNVLKPAATYTLMATSRSVDSPTLHRETRHAMDGYAHAAIHFNIGIHGRHLAGEDYARHLRAYGELLRSLAPDAKLLFGSSTPLVRPGTGQPDPERNALILARNAAAARVMADLGIPVNDLYPLVVGRDDLYSPDGTHLNQQGSILLGEAVGKAVLAALRD